MKLRKFALLAMSLPLIACADAKDPSEKEIKKSLESLLRKGVVIDSIRPGPFAGLYEVVIGKEVHYTDKTGTFLVDGRVLNLKTRTDLTQARTDELNKIKFDELPLELALKTVKGNGKRTIAIFEDPNCGYCKKFRQQTLKDVDNVTVYTFMYNILSPDSFTKSQNIWCAADRNKAWDDWMVSGKPAPAAPAECTSPNDKVLALGQKLNITGTPAIFFTDGSRIPGAIDLATLESKLSANK